MEIGKKFGAIFLIVGTCIGAGMLGLPMVTSQCGIVTSLLLVTVSWFFMLLGAFTIIELTYHYPDGTNFKLIANDCLGKFGQSVTWWAYILLLYSLLSAYMTGGASIITSILGLIHLNIPNWLGIIIFLSILTPFVYSGTRSVDLLNRILLSTKIFFLLLGVGFILRSSHLSFQRIFERSGLWVALPVVTTAYTFHYIIPTIKSYLKVPKRQLQIVVILGSLIPLMIYLLWEFSIIGVFPLDGPNSFASVALHGNKVGDFLIALDNHVNSTTFSTISVIFYNIAVTTSFLGTSISLLHFNENTYQLEDKKWISYLATFLIPFLLVAINPNLFLALLSYAGVFVAVLFLIVPGFMYMRKFGRKDVSNKICFMTISIIIILVGLTVITAQFIHYF